MSKVLYDTTNYEVIRFGAAMGEDGEIGADGYAVRNKDTGVIEHSTVILPQAIYQAQGFSDSLDALFATKDAPIQLSLVEMDIGEDMVPS